MEPLASDDPVAVGPYRLVGRLGAGGMGLVYLGRGQDGALAAVKVVHSHLAADPGFRTRFAREMDVVRSIRGHWMAGLLGGDSQAERPWLATEYIGGPSLDQVVDTTGPLPAASIGVLALRLAEALAQLHGQGVVHRDLKPSNVLLAADGPRLIDFGIARAADATAITQTGAVVGTPPFMSPEQALGTEIGPPSDVFSLASVLVFAMTGSGPFGVVSSPIAMLRRISDEEPDLAAVPERFRPVLAACFAKEPTARSTAGEVRQRLVAGALATDSWHPTVEVTISFTRDQPPVAVDRSARVSRRMALIGTGAGVGLIALTFAGVSMIRSGTPSPPQEVPAPATTPSATGPTPSVQWTAPGSQWVDALIATEELVFISGGSGVRAIDTATHAERWRYDVTGPANNPLGYDPAWLSVGPGMVFYSVKDVVRAFDAATGQERWSSGISGGNAYWSLSGVEVGWSENTLYTTYARKVFALDPATGQVRWEFEVMDGPEVAGGRISAGSPQAVDGRCYVTTGAGVEAIDAATGRRLWRYATGEVNASGMTVAGDIVVLASSTGRDQSLPGVTALDANTGAVRWQIPLTEDGANPRSSPLIVDDLVLVLGDSDGQIHALDVMSGATRWVWPGATGGGGGTDRQPAIDNGVVYVASSTNDRLFALESTAGTERWQMRLERDVYGVKVVAAHAGTVYTACRTGGSDGARLLAVAAP